MKKQESKVYLHPGTLKPFKLMATSEKDGIVKSGKLLSDDGDEFDIKNMIPDLTWPKELQRIDEETRKAYDKLASEYDKYASLPFLTYYSEEEEVREKMIDQLNIKPNDIVLEIGCGDGRGSEHIARRLKGKGKLYLQELSPAFLKNAVKRLNKYPINIEYAVANGCYLPFQDNYFDAAHHFGGLNTFSDIKRCLSELVRVVKPGGKVVVGDESMAPWLRASEFGKIMMNSNPLLTCKIPFDEIPPEARNVKVEWIMLGAFFVLEFTSGEGVPEADYHIPIPSERGGTHWTRFYGNIEGITDETRKLALEAIKKSGKSRHQWMDDVIKKQARMELGL